MTSINWVILAVCCVLSFTEAQTCDANDFVVKAGNLEYLRVNVTGIYGCIPSVVNLCRGVQSLSLSDDGATLSISDGNSITIPDSSSANELQSLSLSNDGKLSISSGNTITLPDSSETNELQNLSLSTDNTTLSIARGNSIRLPDPSATNELQSLSLSGDGKTLSISSGNTITLPDSSETNEIQNLSLSTDNTTLSIVRGNSIPIPDPSATNELQSLSLSGDGKTLSISSGNSVTIPDSSATNELQTLSYSAGSIVLSQGGGSVPTVTTSKTIQKDTVTFNTGNGGWTLVTGMSTSFTSTGPTNIFLLTASVRFNTVNPSASVCLSFQVFNAAVAQADYIDIFNSVTSVPVVFTANSAIVTGLAPGTYTATLQVTTVPAAAIEIGASRRISVTTIEF